MTPRENLSYLRAMLIRAQDIYEKCKEHPFMGPSWKAQIEEMQKKVRDAENAFIQEGIDKGQQAITDEASEYLNHVRTKRGTTDPEGLKQAYIAGYHQALKNNP